MKREHVPFIAARLLDGRPVRWSSTVGDFDGRGRVLEVFNADAKDQLELSARIDARSEFSEAAGGPVIVIFHSVRQSRERHGEFIDWFTRVFPKVRKAPADLVRTQTLVDSADDTGPHRRVAA